LQNNKITCLPPGFKPIAIPTVQSGLHSHSRSFFWFVSPSSNQLEIPGSDSRTHTFENHVHYHGRSFVLFLASPSGRDRGTHYTCFHHLHLQKLTACTFWKHSILVQELQGIKKLWKQCGRDLVDMGPFVMIVASQKKAENLEIQLVPTMPSFLVSFLFLSERSVVGHSAF